ncbi:MAG: hypothetical protein KKA42_07890 [candidate division Zixibacteria bacterium]|nr:hypothetical protein [candidate division Zixibacteria bacterium]
MRNIKPETKSYLRWSVVTVVTLLALWGCASSDDPTSPTPVTPSVSIADASIAEGNSGTVILQFVVTISSAPAAGSDAIVDWATSDGTATTADNDYTTASGFVMFESGGSLTQNVMVGVTGDTDEEPDETLTITLSNARNATISDATATGTIVNDDAAITISINDNTVPEGDAGTSDLSFTVSISAEPSVGANVTVDWATADGTATVADDDYVAGSGTLTFVNGAALSQLVTVAVNGDATEEPDETMAVNLSNAVNAGISDVQGVGTITNDDTTIIVSGDLMVDPTSPGPEDGLTWATAYHTIQAAVDVSYSAGGGEIWVAANTYTSGSVDPTVPVVTMKTGVEIYGGFEGYGGGTGAQETARAQRDYDANVTILDGEDVSDHVVLSQSVMNAVVDGFTITGGYADDDTGGGIFVQYQPIAIANCIFTENFARFGAAIYLTDASSPITDCEFFNNTASSSGGAIYMYRSSPTVTNCPFTDNEAGLYGGGMYIYDDTNPDSEPIIRDCSFSGDTAVGAYGGAIFCRYASPRLAHCTFTSNSGHVGGGMYIQDCTPSLDTCTFTSNDGGIEGGGIYSYTASPELTYCYFITNLATRGSGMYNYQSSSPILTDCNFTGNVSTTTNVNSGGGGMLNTNNCAPVLTRCVFSANTTVKQGGGMHNYASSPTLIDCVFSGNTSEDVGGGLHNDWYSWPVVQDCQFLDNDATVGGGGMSNTRYSSPRVSNCLFAGNQANDGGGLRNRDECYPVLANCTFSKNEALNEGGAMRNEDFSSPSLINCILYNDSTGCIYPEVSNELGSQPHFSHCIILTCGGSGSWLSGIGVDDGGNLEDDPLWFNAATYNFRLQAGSPGIDAGNNIDIYDLDFDSDSTEVLPISMGFYGNPRFRDDPATDDTGTGTAPIIDIGIHEF